MVVPRICHLYFKSDILVLESKRAFWKSRTADAEYTLNVTVRSVRTEVWIRAVLWQLASLNSIILKVS